MSLNHSTKIVTDGLVFYYDMANTKKSWKGKPTTNFAFNRNARIDSSYSTYSATTSGTWNQKHPDAIRVYNDAGSEISSYVNTGVTDWTNTYHAIWTLDSDLKRPVVTMRDFDGQWKAKSFSLDQNMTSMGLSTGNTYSISWLQWTDDITKSANAGLYGLNTLGSNGFHDGLSNAMGSSFNTLTHTWQRVYATFTVSASWNMLTNLACYMYGHYIKRGTLKIADVQIETGNPSGFTKYQTRNSTQAILDAINNNNIVTINSLTYNANGTFSFNGSSNSISISQPNITISPNGFTISSWIKPTQNGFILTPQSAGVDHYLSYNSNGSVSVNVTESGDVNNRSFSTPIGIAPLNAWSNISLSIDNLTIKLFVNGIKYLETTQIITIADWSGSWIIGQRGNSTNWFGGGIDNIIVYNRAISDNEVLQNFNATRSRYGI